MFIISEDCYYGFYLPDGTYEPICDFENDMGRLIREYICEDAEVSFLVFLSDILYKDDVQPEIDEAYWKAERHIDEIKELLNVDYPDVGSIEKVISKLEDTLGEMRSAVDL